LARQAGSYRDVKRFAASSTGYRLHYPSGQAADAWRLAYPMAFEDEVDQSAVDHGVERALVWAIMREESSFDPGVESWANAIGLMQLLLPTAKSVAQRLGLQVNRRNLRNPEINISLGAAYLSTLSRKFRHPALAIAGYNAGEGAVARWLTQWNSGQDLDLFIESIPYDQTRGYTKRVLSSYATYSFLYSGSPRQIPQISLNLP
jgi:soluble lytic murein transglycosylase